MAMTASLLSVLGLIALLCATSGAPVAYTKYGAVRGKTLNLKEGKKINRFHGVPFAKPPVGSLRWKRPEEPDPWDGIYDANRLNAACPQSSPLPLWATHAGWTRFSEDCLYANIFAPNASSDQPYPVMVWLHGGAYSISANIQYPGHFLSGYDVVVVVPNYRLGALGFLSTNDDVARGNWGLLDQIRALEFVRDNIAAFGGDPQRVTLVGQSAGAASTGLLSLSPKAKDLFHQLIMQSGSDQAFWAINPPQSRPEVYTEQVARQLDCPTNDTPIMVDCLRTKDANDIIDADVDCNPGYFCLGFAPVIDGPGGVLPEDPWTLRDKQLHAKVPLLSGQTTDDGALYTMFLLSADPETGFNRSTFETLLKEKLIEIFVDQFPEKEQDVFEGINWYYSPWPYVNDESENREAFNVMITDAAFGVTSDLQIQSQSRSNDVFHYLFGYRSSQLDWLIPQWLGVPHIADIPYTFGYPLLQTNYKVRLDSGMLIDPFNWDQEDIEWTEYVMELWTNFAKHGNPTPYPVKAPGNNSDTIWKKFTPDSQNYLLMRRTVEDGTNYRQRNFAFWRDYMTYVADVDFLRPRQTSSDSYDTYVRRSLLAPNRGVRTRSLKDKLSTILPGFIQKLNQKRYSSK